MKRWREANYRNATPVTRQLLAHWSRADRPRRLFFCQREAVETVIYLNEILAADKQPGFKPKLAPDDFRALTEGVTLLLEIKGEERERDRAKHQAARRWVSAVNYWGQLGQWAFHACQDPQRLSDEIRGLPRRPAAPAASG